MPFRYIELIKEASRAKKRASAHASSNVTAHCYVQQGSQVDAFPIKSDLAISLQ